MAKISVNTGVNKSFFDATAWVGGVAPVAGDACTISATDTLTLDVDALASALGVITCQGRFNSAFATTRTFSGAINISSGGTLDYGGAASAILRTAGNQTFALGSACLQSQGTAQFDCVSQGQYGRVIQGGAFFTITGGALQGIGAGLEAYESITCAQASYGNTLSGIQYNRLFRVDATSVGGILLSNMNRTRTGQVTLGNIPTPTNMAGTYDYYVTLSQFPNTSGTITTNNTGATSGSMNFVNTNSMAGLNITRSAGNLWTLNNAAIGGAITLTPTGTAVMNITQSKLLNAIITINGSSTGAPMFNGNQGAIVGCAITYNNTAATGTNFQLRNCCIENSSFTVDGGAATAFVIDYSTTAINSQFVTQNKTGGLCIMFAEGKPPMTATNCLFWNKASNNASTTGITFMGGGTAETNFVFSNDTNNCVINEVAGTLYAFNTTGQNVEPNHFIKNSTTFATDTYWLCFPSNRVDNSAGNTDYELVNCNVTTTNGAITIAGGGANYARTSMHNPPSVVTWGTLTISTSGTGTAQSWWRYSSNGGETWGAWTAAATALPTPNDDGLDALQFKVINTHVTNALTLSNIQLIGGAASKLRGSIKVWADGDIAIY